MAITRGSVVGFQMKAYWDSASDITTPVWVEMVRVKDLSTNDSKTKADVSRRESNTKLYAGGQVDLSIDFGYQYRKGATGTDVVFDALEDSYVNNTPMHLMVIDGDETPPSGETSRGISLWAEVFEFPTDQALEDGAVYNVSVSPTDVYDATAPDTLLVPERVEISTP